MGTMWFRRLTQARYRVYGASRGLGFGVLGFRDHMGPELGDV